MRNSRLLLMVVVLSSLVMACLKPNKELRFLTGNVKKEDILKADLKIPEKEKQALFFLVKHMSGPQLSVYTNYLNYSNHRDTMASGHDILSESQGLLLLYLLNRDKKEYFDVCLQWTIDNLYLDNGMFSWIKRKTSRIEKTNALIDDFRIIKALIWAYDKWQDEKYLEVAQKASGAIKKYNTKDCIPLDFYDLSARQKAHYVTVSYLDLYTMKKLAAFDSEWECIYSNSYRLIENAKINGTGLYRFQYDVDKKIYSTDEEISLIQSVYTMLHQGETGQHDNQGVDWIWEQYVKYGRLYAAYSSETFEPVNDIESTALYALCARLFYLSGHTNRAQAFLKECERFQVHEEESQIYGSFGNDDNLEVFSFDNLQYILSSSVLF